MNSTAQTQIEAARKWLAEDVFPLWSTEGIDAKTGGFVEALSHDRRALPLPRRAMVQARQIYSFCEGVRMGILAPQMVTPLVERAADYLVREFSLPNGAFVHAVDPMGGAPNAQLDLYSQAFALFGLAEAYGLTRTLSYKMRALKVLSYLNRERRVPSGGYSEIIKGETLYSSNPHMHLFEAALSWMEVDEDPQWKALAADLHTFACTQLVQDGGLGENFDEHWRPLRTAGVFMVEAGHQYEWSWLMAKSAELGMWKVSPWAWRLFEEAEARGVDPISKLVWDEIWSDGRTKKTSSRFWPQGERIKASVRLGRLASESEQPRFARIADEANASLFKYFHNLKPGLWQDTLSADGEFLSQPVKASSLYHIINAFSEYAQHRPKLHDHK